MVLERPNAQVTTVMGDATTVLVLASELAPNLNYCWANRSPSCVQGSQVVVEIAQIPYQCKLHSLHGSAALIGL